MRRGISSRQAAALISAHESGANPRMAGKATAAHLLGNSAKATDLALLFKAVETLTGAVGFAEYRFAPPRRWRWDGAWFGPMVALEVQGGFWHKGKRVHGSPEQLRKDEEKRHAGEELGWKVLYCSPADVANLSAVVLVAEAIKRRLKGGGDGRKA